MFLLQIVPNRTALIAPLPSNLRVESMAKGSHRGK
jgi:hypothetical protein